MSVIVSIFIGLMVSAQEIIRDKPLINREAFLHLNRKAYYHSKVVYLAGLLAVHIFLFVVIAQFILEIRGMLFYYWLILWVSSLVSAIIGLNLSAALRSVVSIYIAVPVLLVPQILLGGAMIKFDKLNSKATNQDYVPIVGDIMPSRWAYEGLAVVQFSKNSYQKPLFDYDRQVSYNAFVLNYYIPELYEILSGIKQNITAGNIQQYQVQQQINLLLNSLEANFVQAPECNYNFKQVNRHLFNITTSSSIDHYLSCSHEVYIHRLELSIEERDKKINQLEKAAGGYNELIELRNKYYNESLARLVLSKDEPVKIATRNGKIIQKADPVFHTADMPFGRSHFYAAEKRLGIFYIETFWFNLLVLGFIFIIFYFVLLFEFIPGVAIRLRSHNFYRLNPQTIDMLKTIFIPRKKNK
jgi:hypothetical protein